MAATPVIENITDVLGGDRLALATLKGKQDKGDVLTKGKIINNNNLNDVLDNDSNNNNTKLKAVTPVIQYGQENEEVVSKGTILQEFYRGKHIFITGGTGFMGKILIQKLLRSCPDLQCLYLLVRNKKGKDVHSRIKELFDDPMFDTMKEEVPKYWNKIEAIPGDACLAGFGLSVQDRQTLVDKVNIVFHAAATVRFDEKIALALSINVGGVKTLLDLCKTMKNLQSLVHVSTAYTNCFRPDPIGECFYDYPIRYEEVMVQIAKLDDAQLDVLTPKILGDWPNTYTFTKAMAEGYIREHHLNLPMGVFRPAIVTSTIHDPVVGWVDNLYGPTGVIAGAGTGLLRTLHCDERLRANVVPVDMCVNALIASAWDIANNCNERKGDNMMVYNYVSSAENPITWRQFADLNYNYGFTYPFATAVWYYCLILTKSAFWDRVNSIVFHYIPAILVDGLSMCVGQKPRLLKVYRKVHKFIGVISFFCTNDWEFYNDNVQALWNKIGAKDKQTFPFSIKEVDWVFYFSYYIKGMRTYLFKEQCTQEEAVRRWKRFYVFHMLLKTTTAVTISYALWTVLYRIFFSST